MLARGQTYETAATSLNLSINTVRTHVRSIYEKLEVTSKTEAVLEGLRRGLTL
jgi:DNA-binding CsgD family transcriptional regulator